MFAGKGVMATAAAVGVLLFAAPTLATNTKPDVEYIDKGQTLKMKGDEHGAYRVDKYDFEIGMVRNATAPGDYWMEYTLPESGSRCIGAFVSLNIFNLMPAVLKVPLMAAFPDLGTLAGSLLDETDLDRFVDGLGVTAYEQWMDAIRDGAMPRVGDVIDALATVKADNLDLVRLDNNLASSKWITGDMRTCTGTVAQRKLAGIPRCQGMMVEHTGCVTRTFALDDTLEREEHGGDDRRRRESTRLGTRGRADSQKEAAVAARERRGSGNAVNVINYNTHAAEHASSISGISATDPAYAELVRNTTTRPNGPWTTNAADYRIRHQLCILMKFADHGGRSLPSRDYFDNLFNSRGGGGASAAGSVRDFYFQNSYYKSDTLTTVLDWVDVDFTEVETSGPGQFGVQGDGLSKLTKSMMNALTYAVTNNTWVDYRKFKMDEDDKITEIMFITSGYPAEFSSAGNENRIWSHKSSFSSSRASSAYTPGNAPFADGLPMAGMSHEQIVQYDGGIKITWNNLRDGSQSVTAEGYLVTNGCFGDGTDGDSCPDGARIGVVAHEMGHGSLQGLSVMDYYEVSNNGRTDMPAHCGGSGEGKGIDSWGIMGDSWGACGDQKFPPMMSAWTKVQLGWADPIEYAGGGVTESLVNSNMCPDIVRVKGSAGGYAADTEFLLFEQRDQVSFDSALPNSGVLAWHVDETGGSGYSDKKNKHPVWSDYTDGESHYYYRLEQGDGADNLECGSSADSGDPIGVGGSITAAARGSAGWKSTNGYHDEVTASGTVTMTVAAKGGMGSSGSETNITVTLGGVAAGDMTMRRSEGCPAGSYSHRAAVGAAANCSLCPVGKYSQAGALCNSGCQVCPDGKYADSEGSSSCTDCPVNTYNDLTIYPRDQHSCVTCPTGNVFEPTVESTGGTVTAITCDGGITCSGMLPLMTQTKKYCDRQGSYEGYSGGEYDFFARKDAGECDSESTFLGLTEEQWMYVGIGTVSFLFVLMIASRMHSHKLHKRAHYNAKARYAQPPRQVRQGHGYAAGPHGQRGGRAGPPPRNNQHPQHHSQRGPGGPPQGGRGRVPRGMPPPGGRGRGHPQGRGRGHPQGRGRGHPQGRGRGHR